MVVNRKRDVLDVNQYLVDWGIVVAADLYLFHYRID
jgi:hypothetical protein